METIFKRAGVDTIYWTMQDGKDIEALLEEVEILGKELFEEDFKLKQKEFPYNDCDGISYVPEEILQADFEACMKSLTF